MTDIATTDELDRLRAFCDGQLDFDGRPAQEWAEFVADAPDVDGYDDTRGSVDMPLGIRYRAVTVDVDRERL